jgi:hypothetical protein
MSEKGINKPTIPVVVDVSEKVRKRRERIYLLCRSSLYDRPYFESSRCTA